MLTVYVLTPKLISAKAQLLIMKTSEQLIKKYKRVFVLKLSYSKKIRLELYILKYEG